MSRQGVTNDPLVWIDCEVSCSFVLVPTGLLIFCNDAYVIIN